MRLFRIALVLAAVAVAAGAFAQSQLYEFPTVAGGTSGCTAGVGLECSDLSSSVYNYVYVNGFFAAADGGGGYFVKDNSASSCPNNGGTVLQDGHLPTPNCFYRASTNWNVREWGAHCDVVPSFSTGTYPDTGGAGTFNSGSTLLDNGKDRGKYIVIPMIGAAPYYPFQSTTNSPGSAGSGYSANDILTFVGGTSAAGPATIQVDMVDGTTGAVTAWHFLTYGAYSVPAGTYTVDDCSGGAGAHHITVMPAAGFIDGSTTYVISTNYGSWTGYYTGLRWKTIATR